MNYGMDYQGDMNGGGSSSYGGGVGGGGGGYTSQSNGTGAGGGGGSGGGRSRRSYDEQTLIPITASMLLSSQADGSGSVVTADGRELHSVKLVGAVRAYEDFSTNVTYKVEDGTGLVEVKQWLDDNDSTAVTEMRQECLNEAVYVKVIGQVKDYDGKKNLVAHSIRRIKDSNEITYHLLEVVYTGERYKHGGQIVGMPPTSSNGVGFGPPLQSNEVGMGGGNSVQDQVLCAIKEHDEGDYGARVEVIVAKLTAGGNITEPEIRKALDDLGAEGHIYTTLNEEYYKYAA